MDITSPRSTWKSQHKIVKESQEEADQSFSSLKDKRLFCSGPWQENRKRVQEAEFKQQGECVKQTLPWFTHQNTVAHRSHKEDKEMNITELN